MIPRRMRTRSGKCTAPTGTGAVARKHPQTASREPGPRPFPRHGKGLFMNRFLTSILGIALLAVMATGSPSFAEEPAAAPPPAEGSIGTIVDGKVVVDLDRIIATALAHNEMLAASGAMKDAADADALGAWRGFLPQLQLGEYFMRSDDALNAFGFKLQNRGVTPLDFGMGLTPTGLTWIPENINEPGETNNFITRIQIMQPIFNGGMSLYGKQAANAASTAAGYKHARAAETIRFHAIQAYEGLTLATAYTHVMESAVKSAEGHVRQARSMVDNEMATEADLLQAKVYLSTLQQKLIEVKNMVRVAGENIKLLCAIDTPLPIVSDFDEAAEALTHQVEMPDFFDVDAVVNRNDILARTHEAEAAGKMVGVARGGMLPHLNLSVQKDWYDLDNAFGTNADSWTLGLYATMAFGVQNLGEIQKAKAQSRAARYMADFETRQAKVQATEAWLNLEAAHEKVLVAREAVVAARAGLKIVTNQYREGLASMVNLLDTQAFATQAEGNLVQALHDYRVGLANLEFNGALPGADKTRTNNPTPAGQ